MIKIAGCPANRYVLPETPFRLGRRHRSSYPFGIAKSGVVHRVRPRRTQETGSFAGATSGNRLMRPPVRAPRLGARAGCSLRGLRRALRHFQRDVRLGARHCCASQSPASPPSVSRTTAPSAMPTPLRAGQTHPGRAANDDLRRLQLSPALSRLCWRSSSSGGVS